MEVMKAPTWRCGHLRTPENTKPSQQCRICHRAMNAAYKMRRRAEAGGAAIAKAEAYLEHRIRYLPGQIEATERKLAALRIEAARLGMTELLGKQP